MAGTHRSDPDGPSVPLAVPGVARDRPSSWLELFFDLVFVAAVAALARMLGDEHSVEGLAVFAGLFVPVWWAWRSFTWLASGFDTGDTAFRVGMLAGMLGSAVLAAGVEGAGTGDSSTFVLAYAGLLLVLVGLYARVWWREPEARPLATRFVVGDGIGAALWLVSLAFAEDVRPYVWAVAMVVLILTPLTVLRLDVRAYDPRHIAERYGLFTLVVLGESVAATISGFDTGEGADAVVVAVLGFVLAAAVWWLYFDRWRAMPQVARAARWVWAQVHLFVFAGIAATAVGIDVAIEAAARGADLDRADRLPLGAGLALYLVAMGLIRAATRRPDRIVVLRMVVGALVAGLALVDLGLTPVAYVALVTALMVASTATDLVLSPPSPSE